MRVRDLLSPKRSTKASIDIFTGRFMVLGLGDGGDDRQELIDVLDNLSVVATLIIGMIWDPRRQAAELTAQINFRTPGVGTAYFFVRPHQQCSNLGAACAAA